MRADKAIILMQSSGIFGLGEDDGCLCCNFNVMGVSVDISCYKSEHCVRVHCGHLDRVPKDVERVAAEVLRQLGEYADASSFRLRFCDYRDDHQNGHRENGVWVETYRCCYCHAPRPGRAAYLCPSCILTEPRAVELYPWNTDGFNLLRPADLRAIVAFSVVPEQARPF